MCKKDMPPDEIPPKKDAEEPAAPEDRPTGAETDALAEVNEALRALRSLFEQKIARDQSQNKMFEAVYDEMKGYREGFLLDSLHKPIIRRLIMLYDNFVSVESQLEGILDGMAKNCNAELPQFQKNLGNVRLELEEVLSSMDVTRYEEPLEALDRKLHKTIGRQSTDDPDQDRKVARIHKRGFYWQGKVFRPEEVTIFHHIPPVDEEGDDTDE